MASGFAPRYSLHAAGKCNSRSVWPVGAVSKMTWSYGSISCGSASKRANVSNAATSTVQAPASFSSKRADFGVGQHTPVRVDDPRPVFVGRDLGVEVHEVKTGDRRNGLRVLAGRGLEHVGEV